MAVRSNIDPNAANRQRLRRDMQRLSRLIDEELAGCCNGNSVPAGAHMLSDGGGGEGEPGPPGPIGLTGPTGSGATGDQGPIGPPGPMAEDGIDGEQGPVGPQGPPGSGATGAQGEIGPALFMLAQDGIDGEAIPGPMGPAGADGGGGGNSFGTVGDFMTCPVGGAGTATPDNAVTKAIYLGQAARAYTSIDTFFDVATVTSPVFNWCEVAIATGDPTLGGSSDLTTRGFTSVTGTFNSTGDKVTTVAVSGIAAGDHMWLLVARDNSSGSFTFRVQGADNAGTGRFLSAAVRPSTMGTPETFTVEVTDSMPQWGASFT